MTTEEKVARVKELASKACFYREAVGDVMLRIECTDDTDAPKMYVLDEDSGDGYEVEFADVPDTAIFYILQEVPLLP